jgi:hypothetical protein
MIIAPFFLPEEAALQSLRDWKDAGRIKMSEEASSNP